MNTKEWYKIRTEFGSMFAKYLTNEITYAEIENKVIGWIEEADNKKPIVKIEFNADDLDVE